MNKTYKPRILILTACSLLVVSGCSKFKEPQNKVLYKDAKSVPLLEVPPDLTTPEFDESYTVPAGGTLSARAYAQHQGAAAQHGGIKVLPESTAVKLVSSGNSRYIQVAGPAELVWPKLRAFWQSMGVGIKRDEPRIGVMETEWVENKAGLPMDWFRKALGKVFQDVFDSGTRDRFRIRVEKPSANSTNIFLTHSGAEQHVSDEGVKWGMKGNNPEIEAEVRNRLVAFLQGGKAKQTNATTQSTSDVTRNSTGVTLSNVNGYPALKADGQQNSLWIKAGVLIERMGMGIEKQDREGGVYTASYLGETSQKKEKRGFWSRIRHPFGGGKMVADRGQQFQFKLTPVGNQVAITAMNGAGQPLSNKEALKILNRLKVEFDR